MLAGELARINFCSPGGWVGANCVAENVMFLNTQKSEQVAELGNEKLKRSEISVSTNGVQPGTTIPT
jgi:hypothetical protein